MSLKSNQCLSFDPQQPLKSYDEDAGTSASVSTATKNADDDHDLPKGPGRAPRWAKREVMEAGSLRSRSLEKKPGMEKPAHAPGSRSTCARAATNQTTTPPTRRRQAARDQTRAVVGVRVSCEVERGRPREQGNLTCESCPPAKTNLLSVVTIVVTSKRRFRAPLDAP